MKSKSKVLVTGADGFIGSHLVEALVRLGYDVKAFTLYNSMNSWGCLEYCHSDVKASIEVISGNIMDKSLVLNSVENCDYVLHLAALISVPYSFQSPSSFVDTNVIGTLNVLEACKLHNVRRLCHTSTSEVYGTAKYVPINEEHNLYAQSPYAASKIGADQLVNSFYNSYKLPAVIIRPFNTYGPRQSQRALIPAAINQLISRQGKVKLGSLTPTRDFSYIEDTVSGILKIMESNEGVGEVYNLGTNFEISIKDTIRLIAEIINTDVVIEIEKERIRPEFAEVSRLCSDNTKIINQFGWKPEYVGKVGLKRGITKTVEWFLDKNNTKNYKSNIYNI